MKKTIAVFVSLFVSLLAMSSFGVSQAVAEKKTASQVLDGGIKTVEGEFVPAAEAMPEDKYDFAPSNGDFKGVRTFGGQVKHVAEANYYFFGGGMSEADMKVKSDAIEKL